MKLSTTKLGLKSLLAGFFLFGALLFSANQAQAQSATDKLNWKSSAEAQTILTAAINQEGQNLSNLTPGTPAYENAEMHAGLYKLILTNLYGGATVPASVEAGVGGVDVNQTDANPQAQTTRTQLFNEIVVMLTN